MKASRLFVLSVGCLVACAGCPSAPSSGGGGGGGNGGGNGSGVDLPATTKVLDSSTLRALESVSDDGSTFTFSGSANQLGSLRVGDVIVSDVSEPLLPYGTLRRVDAIERTGGSTIVRTSATGLAQAVENGSLSARIPLALEEDAGGGKLVPRMLGPGQLVFPFTDVVLFDGDKNAATTDDQIVMNGNLTLEPEIIIDIEISNFSLQKAAIEVVGRTTASITIESRREATFHYEDVLLAVPFPKVVVPLGPIPVVLVPILEIRGGADGAFSAHMTTDLTLDADTEVGMGYDGGFGPILNVDPTGSAEFPQFLDGVSADGEVWLSARFKVAVYGLAGAFVESKFYGKAHVDAAECPWWNLKAGVAGAAGAYAGISVELLIFDADINIFEWSTDPLKSEKLIAEAEGCAPSASQSGLDIFNWAWSYGADNLEYPVGLAVTPDGGAVVAGSTYSYTSGTDAYLMKIDPMGRVSWQMGYDDLRAGVAVAPIDEGYYLLAGERDVSTFLVPPFVPDDLRRQEGDPPSYLLRLDANGDPLWAKAFAATDALDAAAMGVLPNGDAVVAGTIGDPPDGEDVWVARFDAEGSPVWARRIGGSGMSEETVSMIVDSQGDIVVLASRIDGSCDWTIKFNADGDVIWQACYAGAHNNWPAEIVEVPGGYLLVGSLEIHAQVNRIDHDGNLLWARHIDSDGIERDPDTGRELTPDKTPYDVANAAAAFSNGDVLVAGKTDLGSAADFWAFRLDGDGTAKWMRHYGGNREDIVGGFSEFGRIASTVAVTPDGGALLAGYTASFSHAVNAEDFDLDTWIVKIRGLGTVTMNAGSGALATAGGGEVDTEVNHYRQVTTAEVAPFDLLIADFTPVVFSTSFDVVRQGGVE